MAALSFAIARNFTDLNPDEAFLAGLLHNVGKLYILTRAEDNEFLNDEHAMEHVLDEWHGAIGRSIIESWGFSEEQALAAEAYLDLDRSRFGQPDMTDVVQAAHGLGRPRHAEGKDEDEGENGIDLLPAASRLGLNADNTARIVQDSNAEIRALSDALRG